MKELGLTMEGKPMEIDRIESFVAKHPIYQYSIVPVSEIPFSENVREICKNECNRYGKSWSCPPAVGTVEECRERCMQYKLALVFSTVAETGDAYDFDSVLHTNAEHEDITWIALKKTEIRYWRCPAIPVRSAMTATIQMERAVFRTICIPVLRVMELWWRPFWKNWVWITPSVKNRCFGLAYYLFFKHIINQ